MTEPNQEIPTDDGQIVKKSLKVRSQKQIDSTAKMLETRRKLKEQREAEAIETKRKLEEATKTAQSL